MKKIKEKLLMIGGGILIGAANGFLGGGGGMLLVPLLEKVFKEPTKKAHATAILIILPISIASAIVYLLNGYFKWDFFLSVTGGVIVGGIAGALLLKKLNSVAVGIIFALLMIGVGIRMIIL